MAKTVIGATIDIDVKNSTKDIDALTKEMDDLRQSLNGLDEDSQEYQDTLEKINKQEQLLAKETNEVNKAMQKKSTITEKVVGGFKKVGLSIKSLGLGLLKQGWDQLENAFNRNSKAAGILAGVIASIEAVFNKVIEIVVSVTEKVAKNTNGFEGLSNVIKGLIGLIGGNLKIAFSTIALIIQEAQLAWEQSFFGDKDPESIKKLNESIEQSKKSIKEAAKQSLEAGKLVITNIGQAASEVGQVVVGVVDEAQKIDSKFLENTFKQGQALQQLAANAAIAKERLAGIRAEGEREAELLRQQRDNQNLSIEERIAANEKLAKVLDKIRVASLGEVDASIQKARVERDLNAGNAEKQAAYIAALNQRKDVEAQIVGLFSEQKANAVALGTELQARDKSAIEGANAILFERKKANAEAIQDELKKNIELQKIRNEERKTELSRLRDNINNTEKGTQARVDAEIAYNQKKKELDLADQAAFIERLKIVKQRLTDERNARAENDIAEIGLRKQLNDQAIISAIEKSKNAIELAKLEAKETIKQLLLKRDAEIAAAKAAGLSTIEIRRKYGLQIQAINSTIAKAESEQLKLTIENIKAEVDAVMGAAQSISGLLGTLYQNELASLDEQKQRRIQAAGDNKDAVLAIERETAIQRQKILDKQFRMDKTMAIVEATINTFKAASQVFARPAPGDPVTSLSIKISTMIAAIVQGIANVAKIKQVKAPAGFSGGSDGGSISTGAPISMSAAPSVIAQAVNTQAVNQLSNQGMRAYVLNSDIQNNEQRNAYLQRNARIG